MVKTKNTYKFKPQDNVHTCISVCAFLLLVPFDVMLLIGKDSLSLLILLIINSASFLIAVISRLLYGRKYKIDDEYLIKYRHRKIIFKIKVADIDGVFIRRRSPWSFFVFIYYLVIGNGYISGERLTNLSIVFKKCEVIKQDKDEAYRISIKPEAFASYYEHCEIISFRKCKKICAQLGIDPIFIN